MRINAVHNENRRVQPVDRRPKRDQQEREEDARQEHAHDDDAYLLHLARMEHPEDSPALAYTRVRSAGALRPARWATSGVTAARPAGRPEGGSYTAKSSRVSAGKGFDAYS